MCNIHATLSFYDISSTMIIRCVLLLNNVDNSKTLGGEGFLENL